jgi:DDE superfamily endonuclease
MWCIPKVTPAFEQRMMDVLSQYEQPYDPTEPRINVDEKTMQLLTTPRGSQSPKPGRSRRTDYEYERNGTANIFVCVEPKAGKRICRVTKHRTAKDTAQFLHHVVMDVYKGAAKVHITADNLNTHVNKVILERYGEKEGEHICDRIVWHHTPKHASWLNAAEIEISVLSRRTLRRRTGSFQELQSRVAACERLRNRERATIDWRFTREKAREKFHLPLPGN